MTTEDKEPEVGIEAQGLTKVFYDRRRGDVTAAEDVSFNCLRGEVFALLGPNGAGKTTTLRMLSTVLRPTTGTARIADHDINEDPLAVRRSIGLHVAPRLTSMMFCRPTMSM